MAKNPVSKRGDAERASEWYAIEKHLCVLTRRSIRTRFNKVDFFCCDTVGKKQDGTHVYIQVTAGNNTQVTKRRRKLESVPWHETDTVELLQLIQTPDPANARRKHWFFRVHVYYLERVKGFRQWITLEKAVQIPKYWFRSWELSLKKSLEVKK